MNIKLTALLGVLTFGIQISNVGALTVAAGNQLEIGPDGSNQVPATSSSSYGGAIGSANTVYGYGTLALGISNYASGGCSLAVGRGNSDGADSSVISGYYNTASGLNNVLMFGSYNSDYAMYGEDGPDYITTNSLIGGSYNSSTALDSSLIVGENNSAWGAESSAVIGHGLINNWDHCAVVGQYNISQSGTSLLFVVGNGADASNRKNAVEVYNDGSVIIPKRQGDISMGDFGNGD